MREKGKKHRSRTEQTAIGALTAVGVLARGELWSGRLFHEREKEDSCTCLSHSPLSRQMLSPHPEQQGRALVWFGVFLLGGCMAKKKL